MTHNYDSLYSVYSSNKVKEDNFLGQCELPLVPGLPEFTPNESSPQTGQKDCILRYDSSIMTMTHDDSFRPRTTKNRVRGHIKIRLRYLPDPTFSSDDSGTVSCDVIMRIL